MRTDRDDWLSGLGCVRACECVRVCTFLKHTQNNLGLEWGGCREPWGGRCRMLGADPIRLGLGAFVATSRWRSGQQSQDLPWSEYGSSRLARRGRE